MKAPCAGYAFNDICKYRETIEWRELCKWIEGLPYAEEMIICPTRVSTTP